MKPRVYLETSIIGYLTSWPSRDLVTAARQQIKRDWWRDRRGEYELYVSIAVVRECAAGDPVAAAERKEVLNELQELTLTPEALALSNDLLAKVPLPAKANVDALHIAVAAAGGMDYLLTWNCRHIANAEFRVPIESICIEHGFDPLVICTPEELKGGTFHGP
jgi:hypothetical protein